MKNNQLNKSYFKISDIELLKVVIIIITIMPMNKEKKCIKFQEVEKNFFK